MPSIKIALSLDFDAISGWLGTNQNPSNQLSDLSSGYFAAEVGVPRLLRLLSGLDLADKVTWCIPCHSAETFPTQTSAIISSGAEIALHGYSHEGGDQLTPKQEVDVLEYTMKVMRKLTGKQVKGYRAPLYKISEHMVGLLQEKGFLWDSSLAHHDSRPYFLPKEMPEVERKGFEGREARDWMKPSKRFDQLEKSGVVEIPCNWYMEDMTPLQFFPSVPNSAGYVDVRVVERMWMDRFLWLKKEVEDGRDDMVVFSLVLHPDTSGMAHVIGMIERFLIWLKSFGDEVEFWTYERIAAHYVKQQEGKMKE